MREKSLEFTIYKFTEFFHLFSSNCVNRKILIYFIEIIFNIDVSSFSPMMNTVVQNVC